MSLDQPNQNILNKLPNEVLARICRVYLNQVRAQCCRFDLKELDNAKHFRFIMNFSQVCRRWRDVVIRSPAFWRHFINPHHRSVEWTQLLLERSKPLGITYSTLSTGWDGLRKEVTHGDKLISYSVICDDYVGEWADKCVPSTWPKLQFLCVHLLSTGEYDIEQEEDDEDETGNGYFLLPIHFPTHDSTPELKRLHLHSCALSSYKQLVGLKGLTEWRHSKIRIWDVPGLVKVLGQLPHLKRLALDDVLVAWDREPEPGGEDEDAEGWESKKAELKRVYLELEEFCLNDFVNNCSRLFRRLNLRCSHIFRLQCSDASKRDGKDIRYLFSRTTPIIHRLFTSASDNGFSKFAALKFTDYSMEYLGFPQNTIAIPDHLPWTDGPGSLLFDGVHVSVDFSGHQDLDVHTHISKLMRPLSGQIDALTIESSWYAKMFFEDAWFSTLLWEYSPRLRQLKGIELRIWILILENIKLVPGQVPTKRGVIQQAGSPFLGALEDLQLTFEDRPKGYPLEDTIVEFCNRKSMNVDSRPLKRFKIEGRGVDESELASIMGRLKSLGINN